MSYKKPNSDWEAYKLIFTLRNMVSYHNRRYHDDDSPELSDYSFDLLFRKLEQLEKEYPWSIKADSPTQAVGGSVRRGFKKAKHLVYMGTLKKVYTPEEFEDWDLKLRKWLD